VEGCYNHFEVLGTYLSCLSPTTTVGSGTCMKNRRGRTPRHTPPSFKPISCCGELSEGVFGAQIPWSPAQKYLSSELYYLLFGRLGWSERCWVQCICFSFMVRY
jgi:hypothetical protein